MLLGFYFCKQKTAYEMRISDWSSTCALPICGIHSSAREHQGHAKSCLKVHLFASAARRIIESLNRPLRPTVAFHEQGHCQEDWRRCGRQSDADPHVTALRETPFRSEEHTSALQSLMRTSYAVFCLKKKNTQ